MVVTPEDLRKKTDDEIVESMLGATFDSDHYKHCTTFLQIRHMARTLEATSGLVLATSRLVYATWGLVIATVLLLIGAVLPLFLRK